MLSIRYGWWSVAGGCLIGTWLGAPAVFGQEQPRRQAAATKPAATKPAPTKSAAPTPPKQRPPQGRAAPTATRTEPARKAPQRQAAAPGASHLKINQFAPRPRQPQATWGQLSPEQNAALELVLQAWERRSAQVRTLECSFQCWIYDAVFGAAPQNGLPPPATRICRGKIRYAEPDKGHYHITQEAKDPTKDPPEFVEQEGEHWVCDGNAVYEFDRDKQQLIERRLPGELKGKAIANSPLPFVFGTTADRMRQRYWMRLATPQVVVGKEIWLQVEPIYSEDRANYQHAMVILEEKVMLPKAISLELPNGSKTNYVFDDFSINNAVRKWFGVFDVPKTPKGWKRIIEEAPGARGQPAPPDNVQTLRVPQIKRK